MAEEPRVFTVAPWGYRILLPELLGTFLPPRLIVPGFEWAARISLVCAAGLLFIYLRALGGTQRAALIAVAGTMLAPPIAAVFDNPFLVEPFALALFLVALIAIEGGASLWAIALSLILLSLSKEIWIFLLPLIFVRRLEDDTPARAALVTFAVAAPSLWVGAFMRWMWAHQTAPVSDGTSFGSLLGAFADHAGTTAIEYALGGLTVVAVFALRNEDARAYLRDHALTLLALLVLPAFAAVYTGEGAATSFFSADVRRLLIYALPLMAGLAVHLDPEHGTGAVLPVLPTKGHRAVLSLVLGFLLAPAALIRYSRVDLSTSRDGPYVLGFVRETLRTARKLDRGEAVVFDPATRRFAWGVSPPNELSKLRFFLRDGFGPLAHYGIHDILMRGPKATLVVPAMAARTIFLTLTLDARESGWITFSVGGKKVGEALTGPQAVRVTLEIPGALIRPGDNLVELDSSTPAALPRLLRMEVRQAAR